MKQDAYIPLHSEDKEPISPDATTFPSCTDGEITIDLIEIVEVLS